MKEYFSHDYGARHDRKVVALVNKYKAAGYGIFWATNEMMHEENGNLELDEITFGAIAKHLNEDIDLVKSVITDCINMFKLYILFDEKLLTSNRVKVNLAGYEERKLAKIESGRLGGIKSGESRRSKQNEATLQANEAHLEANEPKKEKKEKKESIESKEINKEKDFVFWENEKKQFLNSGDWIYKFCTDKNIEVKEFDEQAKKFLDDTELKEDFKELKELKRHFTNWYNLNKNKNGKHASNNNEKLGTSAARIDALKKW